MERKPGTIEKPSVEHTAPIWEACKPLLLGKEHFELQFAFAKEIATKNNKQLLNVIAERAGWLRSYAFEFDEKHRIIGPLPGVTEENVLKRAYEGYVNDHKDEAVPYHREGETRYGCFSYDMAEDKQALRVHFFNAEFDTVGPLDKTKIAERQHELADMLIDIKRRYPDMQELRGLSWLYNLSSYKRLFPQSYIDNLKINTDPFQWARGTTIWGQFMDYQYNLKQDLADELIRRVRALPPGANLSSIFDGGPPLMPPLETHASPADFYEMYNVR